jgi:lysozyme
MLSPFGIELLERFEAFSATTYQDAAGIATIGYGHRIRPGESFPAQITLGQAYAVLLVDAAAAEQQLLAQVTRGLADYQREALVSFVYNLGIGKLVGSTMLELLNAGNDRAAAWEFGRWCYARDPKTGQKVQLPGLLRRRLAEEAWFLGGSQALVVRVWEGRK